MTQSKKYAFYLYGSVISSNEPEYWQSNDFEIKISDNITKWRIAVCCSNGHLYCYLHNVSATSTNFLVKFFASLSYSFPNGKKVKTTVSKNEDCPLIGAWLHITYIGDILRTVDYYNNFLLKFRIYLRKNGPLVTPTKPPTEIASTFANYYNSKDMSDITLISSDGKEIPAHRLVLSSASFVLKTKIDNPPKKKAKIKMDEDGDTLQELLRYIYTGKIENDKIKVLAPKLIVCGEKYKVESLKILCASSLIKEISFDNVVDLFNLAKRSNACDLMKLCILFIKINLDELKQCENWKKLEISDVCHFEEWVESDHPKYAGLSAKIVYRLEEIPDFNINIADKKEKNKDDEVLEISSDDDR